jgi:hypothetical protein
LLFHHVEYTNSCKRWLINQGVAAQKSNIPAGKYLRVGKKNKKIKKEKKNLSAVRRAYYVIIPSQRPGLFSSLILLLSRKSNRKRKEKQNSRATIGNENFTHSPVIIIHVGKNKV